MIFKGKFIALSNLKNCKYWKLTKFLTEEIRERKLNEPNPNRLKEEKN